MEWKNANGYEGYLVSNTGLVQSIDRHVELKNGKKRFLRARPIKSRINNFGYVEVRLSKNGNTKTCFVHRLVAKAFIPNPNNLPQVNHLSGNKQDNTVENLEWTDASGNALHAYQTGLNTNCGCTHNLAVAVIDLKTGEIYCTIKALCEFLGIPYSTGRNALNGIQNFPKYVDVTGHAFEKYSC
jgi:hypothetical protein